MTSFELPLNIAELTKPLPTSLEQMVQDMQSCEQTEGFSVLQHGEAVRNNFWQLKNLLFNGASQLNDEWRLPSCVWDNRSSLANNLHDDQTIHDYTTYHDCGKPYCLTIDESGRRHFPNHALVSFYVWKSFSNHDEVARLIRDDMIFHTCSAELLTEKLELGEWKIKDAVTLYLAALSEIHANASMFGGLDSVSFKMKYKQLERRGKQMCKILF